MDWISTIIPKYLEILLSWPPVILALGFFFLVRFEDSIRTYIKTMSIKAGPVEISQSQQASTEIVPVEQDGTTINQEDRARRFEFLFLNQLLVWNTKLALLGWFIRGSTRENFMNNFPLNNPAILDPNAEREAIFSALLSHGLIVAMDNIYRTNEKGQQFLRFIGLNPIV